MTETTHNPFKLSLCGRYVVEDDGSPHPTIWTLAEARERLSRQESMGADFEHEQDRLTREGRTAGAEVYGRFARATLKTAADLLVVLQGAEEARAA